MPNSIGNDLVAHFGEEIVRELTERFQNGTIPGKKFWIQRTKERFINDFTHHRYTNKSVEELTVLYNISLRTCYAWMKEAQQSQRKGKAMERAIRHSDSQCLGILGKSQVLYINNNKEQHNGTRKTTKRRKENRNTEKKEDCKS